jgi:hypothetical protein
MGERYKSLSNRLRRLLAYVTITWYAVTRGSSDHGYYHCSVRTHSISTRCAQIASHFQLHHRISHRSQEFNLFRLHLFYAAKVACTSQMSSHHLG